MKFYKTFIFWLGLFLIIEGALSILFGSICLNACLNSEFVGNMFRVFRIIGGVILLVLSFTKIR